MIIYLVLAAQFESWIDPFIILTSVPLSLFGALFFASLGFVSLNIYTQVGLITLVGLITKNGILIVEFANRVVREGASKRDAIEEGFTFEVKTNFDDNYSHDCSYDSSLNSCRSRC